MIAGIENPSLLDCWVYFVCIFLLVRLVIKSI